MTEWSLIKYILCIIYIYKSFICKSTLHLQFTLKTPQCVLYMECETSRPPKEFMVEVQPLGIGIFENYSISVFEQKNHVVTQPPLEVISLTEK